MPSVESFVEELDMRLVEGAAPPQHLMSVVVQKCGRKRRSTTFLAELTAALEERGIYPRPGLTEAGVTNSTKIAFSRVPSSGWETGLTFPSERALEDVVVAHYRRIPALKHLKKARRQYPLPSGRKIDVLFEERGTGDLVVAELKVGVSGFGAVAQMITYVDEVATLPIAEGRKVQGLIITGEPNSVLEDQVRALAAQRGVKVSWLCYRLEVAMAPVFEVQSVSPAEKPVEVTYYKVTEPLQTPEFARTIEDDEGLEIQAWRHGEWTEATDLGEAFFLGRGKIERLPSCPV